MLLDPSDWSLAQSSDRVLERLSTEFSARTFPETHAAVIDTRSELPVVGRAASAGARDHRGTRDGRAVSGPRRRAIGGVDPGAGLSRARGRALIGRAEPFGARREPLLGRPRRDGRPAVDAAAQRLVPAREILASLLADCRPFALALGCAGELDRVPHLSAANGADRQRALIGPSGRLDQLVMTLADRFVAPSLRTATEASKRSLIS